MGLLPNWLQLQFPSFGCAKFVNRRHTLSQVCLLFPHSARSKSENFVLKPIRQQTQNMILKIDVKKGFLFRAAAAIVILAVFAAAYSGDHKTPSGGAGGQVDPEPDPVAVESPGNIGTTEGDGKVAPLVETEIGSAGANGQVSPGGNAAPAANASFKKVCIRDKCYQAELAITPQEWGRGLMFRESLGKDQGMLFESGQDGIHKFWMKNTKISLDMVWIGADKKIIFISNNISPCIREVCPSYGPDAPARYVFETNGGEMARLGAKAGDAVIME